MIVGCSMGSCRNGDCHTFAVRRCEGATLRDRRCEVRVCNSRMLDLKFCLHGGCSSGVERRIVDPEVAGSKPVTHPTYPVLTNRLPRLTDARFQNGDVPEVQLRVVSSVAPRGAAATVARIPVGAKVA